MNNERLFAESSLEEITDLIDTNLKSKNESPFWLDKVVPFSRAILSVLIPLREQKLLFTPEGIHQDTLTAELFFTWMDFVSLKTLYFIIAESNEKGTLVRTKVQQTAAYKPIDTKILGDYLYKYNVNLQNENLDFPIANYNVHQGVKNVIKSLL